MVNPGRSSFCRAPALDARRQIRLLRFLPPWSRSQCLRGPGEPGSGRGLRNEVRAFPPLPQKQRRGKDGGTRHPPRLVVYPIAQRVQLPSGRLQMKETQALRGSSRTLRGSCQALGKHCEGSDPVREGSGRTFFEDTSRRRHPAQSNLRHNPGVATRSEGDLKC